MSISPYERRLPSTFTIWNKSSPSSSPVNTVYNAAREWRHLDVSGYKGPKTKPLSNHNYHLSHWEVGASGTGVRKDGLSGWYGDRVGATASYFLPLGASPDSNSAAYNKALDKLNEQLRGDLDLSVDLAEAHSTAKMFRVVSQVEDITKETVRIFKKRYRNLLRVPAGMWLQYTYGIKPLLGSIYGVADNLVDVHINRIKHVRARGTVSGKFSRLALTDYNNGTTVWNANGVTKSSCTIIASVENPRQDIARWASLNPASIAWELTPYSFVVDWFVDVGGYLRNLETGFLYNSRWVKGTRTDLWSGSGSINHTGTGDWTFRVSGPVNWCTIDRTILASYPLPDPPSLKVQLGSSRLLSAASLLAVLLKR